ncbi:MAG: hypothetical protein ABIH35_00300 [Patescibacteria group bacterium]
MALFPGRTELVKELYENDGGNDDPIILHADIVHRTERWAEKARAQYEQALAARQLIDFVRFFRVAIFGSAQLRPENKESRFISDLTKALVEARPIDVVTGGGQGIMEAANEGLELARQERESNGSACDAKNHGLLVELPHEETGNKYLHLKTKHVHFSTRLQDFVSRIHGAYLAQGGYGTLLEKLFLLQLKQVKHLEQSFPIIAHSCWEEIIELVCEKLYHERKKNDEIPLIDEKDLNLIHFTDDIEEIVGIFAKKYDLWKKCVRDRVRYVTDSTPTIPDPSPQS